MLTSFQVRKFTRMFNALDINSDGALDAEDVELVVGRHATESAGRAEPAHLATLEAAYRAWYGGIIQMADHNQDGKVTLEEFLGFQENLMKDAALYEQIIGAITQMTCTILDHDGDGKNDTDDYVQFSRVLRIGEEGATERWAALSAHRDGLMGVEDIRAVLQDFFQGADESSPATNFLGAP
ncbi:MAG: EF-hand domain-containing protein [Sandaracinaceae bacterium]|jgi:Ca2+-binding EF-hand superfamily protein|nr:EF-hand domain-containing protein [Sandaracinaceae bacterium]MBP7682769.1 EF-hand domain-containing protein [Deltaproteobacteria bacterium]MBK6807354.1 EF-hand domain-containing protein [Sandaracinaceae bacterium]MBK7152152.1 EF-hand domain-containing protein [Sandaracinaceae bacterium]MBK8410910.1 EF-hand domain-containing protein [Sandaracinaceae bacterium]